jgi:TPP-dependent pyruvate/acetoin dehydrogenase alpha subunit
VEVEEKVKQVIDEAIEFAENSPEPPLSSLEEDVFA